MESSKNAEKAFKKHKKEKNEYLEFEGVVKKKTIGGSIGFNDRYFLFDPDGYCLFYYETNKRPTNT